MSETLSLIPTPQKRKIVRIAIVRIIVRIVKQAPWCISIIPALGRQRWEDHKFKVSLGCRARPCLNF
jgi:hypothetical protein